MFAEKIFRKTGKGIDGIASEKFNENLLEHLSVITRKIKNKTYKFSKYMELLKSKGRGKNPRLISIPTIRDKMTLIVLKEYLHDVFEESVNRTLPNKCVRDVVEVIKNRQLADPHFFKIDINNFYGSIIREKLYVVLKRRIKAKWILHLIKNAIEQATVPFGRRATPIYEKKGVPQGLPISNILAGIYMTDFDAFYRKKGVHYFRYVDDILFIMDGDNRDSFEPQLKRQLDKLDLEMNEKTDSGSCQKGVDYLGYRISVDKISVRQPTVERYIQSVASMFASYAHNSSKRLDKYKWLTRESIKEIFISDLNEKITGAISENKRYGWIFYFQEMTDIPLLHKMDKIISGFFKRLKDFENSPPKTLKRLVRAHFEAVHSPLGKYIHNYNLYVTHKQKLDYLIKMGSINTKSAKRLKPNEIEDLFVRVRQRHLSYLEADVDRMS